MKKYIPKVLIVDDKIENLIALENLLKDFDLEFVRAFTGNEALAKTLSHDFALALLDVQMPYMDGFETAKFMRDDENTETLPIIFISGFYKDNYLVIKGIEKGPVDFISKPINSRLLKSKAKVFLDLDRQKHELKQLKELINTKNEQLEEHGIIKSTGKEFLKNKQEVNSDAVIVTNKKGEIIFWNKTAEEIFDYTEDLVLGETLNDVFA